MSEENNAVEVNETASFETSVDDTPQIEQQETTKPEEPASSESEGTATDDEGESTDTKQGNEEGSEGDKPVKEPEPKQEDKAERKKNRVQKRIDKLTRDKEEANKRADTLERENQELKAKSEKKPESQEPKEADFETFDQYLDAVDDYEAGQEKQAEPEPEPKQEDGQQAELTESQKISVDIFNEKIKGTDELPEDFKEVAFSDDVPVTLEMVEALSECEDPAKVLYHLGQNKDLASEISEKTAVGQAAAIARLEHTIESKPKKPVTTTKAPDAISPVRGSDTQTKPITEMTFAEHEAMMNKKQGIG